MNAVSKWVARAMALSTCLGILFVPGSAMASILTVNFSSQFFGQIEHPNSFTPYLTNPTATATASIDTAAPHLATGSAFVSDGSNSFVMPNVVVFNVTDGSPDVLGIQWNLTDGNSNLFHLSLTLRDFSGAGVVGTDLTSSVGGWTVLTARLDQGSDNGCCHLNPMDVTSGNLSISVPEPATMLLLSLGLAGLAGFGRRKIA